jgi:hypothetical protein
LLLGLVFIGSTAQAVHDVGEFELDKNATNNLDVFPVGYLASNINASTTSINVCQTGSVPAGGSTILIRAERMTVSANDAGNFGGNCPGDKRTYTVLRGVEGTTASSQSGGANNIGARVSLLVDGTDETKPGPDWDQVYAAFQADPDTTCDGLGLVECTFVEDGIGPTTFTIGSTKDHLPLSGWFHTDGASPDKAEILNAYAAKAITGDDHQIIYFGMDRYAVDGSTDIGFWFFQDEVVACPDPDAGDACDGVPDGQFAGEHVEDDVLILGTFTQGGAASNIRVFKWVDSGGNEQEHIQGPTGEFGDCITDPPLADDDGCATVNNTTIEVPWNYMFKGASEGGWIPAGGFFEGGVDLTAAGLEGCFSSFLAETRSSPEITAILKDFALGAFEACDTELTTTPADGDGTALEDNNDNDIPDVQIGTGSDGVDVTDLADLDVKGITEWDGTLDFYLCGPIAAPATCDTGGVLVTDDLAVDETTTQPIQSDPANLTEVGRYCWRAEFTSATEGVPDADDSTLVNECFEVLPVTPTLSTTAWSTGDATGSAVTTDQPFGTVLYDKANLSGTAYQPGTDGTNTTYPSINATMDTPANGSITFALVHLVEDTGEGACGADATGTGSLETGVTVIGDGDYFSSGFTPDTPGDYTWQASYSSDLPNTLGTSHNDDCDVTAEHVTVLQLNPAITTAQEFVPNDSATITVDSGAGDLAGSVVFKLFVDDADCSETPAYTSGSIDIATGTGSELSRTVMSANTTAYDVNGTTFHWVVEYTSTNSAHTDVTSACGVEHSSITIDNDATGG